MPSHVHQIAYEPDLVPPPDLMATEGITVLEEWFRWAEEWSMLLRLYGRITRASDVLEIGCGLGRIAFPLRYLLTRDGSYCGFEIVKAKVDFLQAHFTPAHPNFRFVWANLHNTHYNPHGTLQAADYRFPNADASIDLTFAASIFTHMLPATVAHYFQETARVLRPGGRAVFSFFLLENYRPGQPRPKGFHREAFNFDHEHGGLGPEFSVGVPDDPEQMTAFAYPMLVRFARAAGLVPVHEPVPGYWSGSAATWIGAQDMTVWQKPA